MASSRNSSKSFGLRILWLPGGRKSRKGRYDVTNKQYTYGGSSSGQQKKNQMWSLGGNKGQRNLVEAEPDTSLLDDGPSISNIATGPLTCTLGSVGAAKCLATTVDIKESPNDEQHTSNPSTTTPQSPSNSTTSTALLLPSQPQSPVTTQDNETTTTATMPHAKALPPVLITTTTAEIQNRFSLLGKDETAHEIDVYTLPSPPKNDQLLLDTSAGTTASTATTPSTSPKSDGSKSNKGDDGAITPTKKKLHRHLNNNQQGDVNSIESISDDKKLPSTDLDWVDEIYLERNGKDFVQKPKNKKKKKRATSKELDQLDGVPNKSKESVGTADEDEKVVTCLYYTIMCCECSIS